MLARGALGQPVAVRAAGRAAATTSRPAEEVLAELDWVMDRAVEHLGADRAGRYLRKFYPWYVERARASGKALQEALQRHVIGRGGARGSRRFSPS